MHLKYMLSVIALVAKYMLSVILNKSACSHLVHAPTVHIYITPCIDMWMSLQAATAGNAALHRAARQCTADWIAAQSCNPHESELWKAYWIDMRQLCENHSMPGTLHDQLNALLGAVHSWRLHCLQHPDQLSPGLKSVLTSATGDWRMPGQPACEYQAVAHA